MDSVASLAKKSGITPGRLRTWERRYGVPAPGRTPSGQRRYSAAEVALVLRMAELVRSGLPASEAAAMAQGADESLPPRSRQPDGGRAGELAALALALDPAGAHALSARAREEDGLASAIENTWFPALEQVGALWHEGRATPAEEHLLTAAVRGELQFAMHQMPVVRGGPLVLLACASSDDHDIGLLALAALLRERSVQTLFLGARMPAAALVAAASQSRAAVVVLAGTTASSIPEIREGARGLARVVPRPVVFAGGPALAPGSQDALPAAVLPQRLPAAAAQIADTVASLADHRG